MHITGVRPSKWTGRNSQEFSNMKNSLPLVIAGLLLAAPALAQGTAGNTPNTGPEGTGNFVAGKPEGEGTGYVTGRSRERDASYTRPEGEGTSYVGGKPANQGK
jgi:hypothetical protein